MLNSYKKTVIHLVKKTNNPITPFALNNLEKGVEATARAITPLCKQEDVDKLTRRLLKDFSDEELNGSLGKSPELLLAILALAKETGIGFIHSK